MKLISHLTFESKIFSKTHNKKNCLKLKTEHFKNSKRKKKSSRKGTPMRLSADFSAEARKKKNKNKKPHYIFEELKKLHPKIFHWFRTKKNKDFP